MRLLITALFSISLQAQVMQLPFVNTNLPPVAGVAVSMVGTSWLVSTSTSGTAITYPAHTITTGNTVVAGSMWVHPGDTVSSVSDGLGNTYQCFADGNTVPVSCTGFTPTASNCAGGFWEQFFVIATNVTGGSATLVITMSLAQTDDRRGKAWELAHVNNSTPLDGIRGSCNGGNNAIATNNLYSDVFPTTKNGDMVLAVGSTVNRSGVGTITAGSGGTLDACDGSNLNWCGEHIPMTAAAPNTASSFSASSCCSAWFSMTVAIAPAVPPSATTCLPMTLNDGHGGTNTQALTVARLYASMNGQAPGTVVTVADAGSLATLSTAAYHATINAAPNLCQPSGGTTYVEDAVGISISVASATISSFGETFPTAGNIGTPGLATTMNKTCMFFTDVADTASFSLADVCAIQSNVSDFINVAVEGLNAGVGNNLKFCAETPFNGTGVDCVPFLSGALYFITMQYNKGQAGCPTTSCTSRHHFSIYDSTLTLIGGDSGTDLKPTGANNPLGGSAGRFSVGTLAIAGKHFFFPKIVTCMYGQTNCTYPLLF